MSRFIEVVKILDQARLDATSLLTHKDDEMLRLSVDGGLKNMINRLKLLSGTGDMQDEAPRRLGPAQTIGGKPIRKIPETKKSDLYPSNDRLDAFKDDIQKAYDDILNHEASVALVRFKDVVLRGLAKRVKMLVGKDNPPVLSEGFVQEIQSRIAAEQKEIRIKAKEQAAGAAKEPAPKEPVLDNINKLHEPIGNQGEIKDQNPAGLPEDKEKSNSGAVISSIQEDEKKLQKQQEKEEKQGKQSGKNS